MKFRCQASTQDLCNIIFPLDPLIEPFHCLCICAPAALFAILKCEQVKGGVHVRVDANGRQHCK
jgi:hypothetical protein